MNKAVYRFLEYLFTKMITYNSVSVKIWNTPSDIKNTFVIDFEKTNKLLSGMEIFNYMVGLWDLKYCVCHWVRTTLI